MTALIVIGAIALFIFILLASSIRVDMEYDQVFKYRVKYLFFTFVKNPLSPREMKRKKKKEQRKKKKQEKAQRKKGAHLKQRSDSAPQKPEVKELQKTQPAKQEKNGTPKKQDKQGENAPEKPKLKFSFDLIKRIIGRASPHVKRIFKKIRLSNVLIDITTGGDDAAKVAISYGVHCSAIYGLVTFLDRVISFKADRISIRADFDLEKSKYHAKGTLKLRLSTLLHSGIWGFFAVLSELRKDSVGLQSTAPEQKKAA